jgi:hypothetical protein
VPAQGTSEFLKEAQRLASYHAIAATSQAILGILNSGCPRSEFLKAEFKLYHASDFDKPMEEGISLFLYGITVNTALRNLPPRVAQDGGRYRPSLPLDLHYLLTAWASDPDQQQRLLGWSMRALEDVPILPAAVLNHYIEKHDTFRTEEAVELICDSLAIQDLIGVWDKLRPRYQTSVTYVARMVAIDSDIKLVESELVQARGFRMRKTAEDA